MRINRLAGVACALAAPLLIGGAVVAQTGVASAAVQGGDGGHHATLYVSPWAKSHNSDRSCGSARYRSIQSAVNAAPAWSTVVVCAGTYHEQVVLAKPLSLAGNRATIDETGVTPTFTVTLPGQGTQTIYAAVVITSSSVSLRGFTIRESVGEGVLAAGLGQDIYNVTIRNNAVVHNDLGSIAPGSPDFECAAEGTVPGDCGEGVHFTGVAYSSIADNYISQNSGGMLISDDTGPTHNNVIEGNVVANNTLDCGITVPGHNPGALSASGVLQPSVAGVYDNVIRGNVVTGNGLKGDGAGVLFANASAGTASYNNLVEGNYIADNGLSGVTMHAHTIAPGQFEDLNGNMIVGNFIGKNNVDGDQLDGPPGPSDLKTTGVLVFSGGTPVSVKIAHNSIANNTIGIWLSKAVTASGLRTNSFRNVTIPVSANN
jgi:nitrous oxidase accessory protein NosD